jgi:hypothetical protein
MTPLFKKLNYKAQARIIVLDAPKSFDQELAEMLPFTEIYKVCEPKSKIEFVICFVYSLADINRMVKLVYPGVSDETVWWFAYPKASSKRYKCEFNRDNGWRALGEIGFEGVRMCAIDEDWSALRFKAAKNIKQFTRNQKMIWSKDGMERARQRKIQ